MCNARNHPPGCNCGWGQGWQSGGYGSSGGRSSFSWTELNASRVPFSSSYSSAPVPVISTPLKNANIHPNVFSGSWVAPNSTCPVCGQNVYFYKSEHGGQVYFDELGPPWPKHVCTNNMENRKTAYSGENRWDRRGWQSLQNFTVTITGRDEGFLVRVQGEDASKNKKYFVCRIADDVQFDIFRFLPDKEVTTLSILAHNKLGEFLIYDGFAPSGNFFNLKIKDFSDIVRAEEKSFNSYGFSEFFKEWCSEKPWSPILNLKINLISGVLYKINAHTDDGDIVFQVRMDEFYFVRYARFQIFGVSSAIVSLVVEKLGGDNDCYILEGAASVGKSFPPGKKLEIKEIISKSQQKSASINHASIVSIENIEINFLDEIRDIDLEINALLLKIAILSQEKNKWMEKFVDQGSLLD